MLKDPRVALLILVLSVAAGFASGWSWNGARWESKLLNQAKLFQEDLDLITKAGQKAKDDLQDEYDAQVAVLTGQSAAMYKEYLDGQAQRNKLADDLRATKRRLSVLVSDPGGSCTSGVQDPPTGSVVHGPRRAYIDPGYGAAIIGVTARGDSEIDKLNACQAYVRKILGKGSG